MFVERGVPTLGRAKADYGNGPARYFSTVANLTAAGGRAIGVKGISGVSEIPTAHMVGDSIM